MPFILRSVALLGIDSVQLPIVPRRELWERLAGDLRPRHLADIMRRIPARELVSVLDLVRAGKFTGRAVIEVADGF